MGKKVIMCPVPNINDHLVNDTLYGENLDRYLNLTEHKVNLHPHLNLEMPLSSTFPMILNDPT